MSKFELANCLVALGGDQGNTVPKYRVTAAEIAVLQAIHGGEAVIEIVPLGKIPGNHRAERQRLLDTYIAKDSDNRSIVDRMFPGAAARVFESLRELQLTANQFKRGKVPAWLKQAAEETGVPADVEQQAYLDALAGQESPELDDLASDDEPLDAEADAPAPVEEAAPVRSTSRSRKAAGDHALS